MAKKMSIDEMTDIITNPKRKAMLDIGCGMNKRSENHIGIDISARVEPEIVCDVTKQELPFEANSIDVINSAHTFEHFSKEELMVVMNECWRVLKWGGELFIQVPHRDCELAAQDPTHKNTFVQSSMKFFCGDYLVKYGLDYPIKCIFREFMNTHDKVPGKAPTYITMIKFGLKKDLKHWRKLVGKFPFGGKLKQRALKLDMVTDVIKEQKKLRFDPEWYSDTTWNTKHNVEFSGVMKRTAKQAINKHFRRMMKIKADATKRYGTNPAHLGVKGLFADLNRKNERLKQYMWEGEKVTSEDIKDTLYDNAIYSILAVMEIEEEENDV